VLHNNILREFNLESSSGSPVEENNRMGKTRDLVKKIRDTEGIFHVKMGKIKDIDGLYLTEARSAVRQEPNTRQIEKSSWKKSPPTRSSSVVKKQQNTGNTNADNETFFKTSPRTRARIYCFIVLRCVLLLRTFSDR